MLWRSLAKRGARAQWGASGEGRPQLAAPIAPASRSSEGGKDGRRYTARRPCSSAEAVEHGALVALGGAVLPQTWQTKTGSAFSGWARLHRLERRFEKPDGCTCSTSLASRVSPPRAFSSSTAMKTGVCGVNSWCSLIVPPRSPGAEWHPVASRFRGRERSPRRPRPERAGQPGRGLPFPLFLAKRERRLAWFSPAKGQLEILFRPVVIRTSYPPQ